MTQQWKQSKGLVIIYVGDGKGKTTAAMGAVVRALGHGWRVYVAQFMKEEKWPSGERDFFRVFTTARGPAAAHPHPTVPIGIGMALDVPTTSGSGVTPREDKQDVSAHGYTAVAPQSKTHPALGEITVEVMGEGFVGIMGDKKARETHREAAQKGYEKVFGVLKSGEYLLVVLDEILSAVDEGLLSEQQILDLIAAKPEDVTLIMTGHKSYPAIFAKADLVTEMKKIKHPFDAGFIAKKGVDY